MHNFKFDKSYTHTPACAYNEILLLRISVKQC